LLTKSIWSEDSGIDFVGLILLFYVYIIKLFSYFPTKIENLVKKQLS